MNNPAEPLSLLWRYDGGRGSLIWQLMFTSTGEVVGQKRFSATRQSLLFCLDAASGELFTDDYLLMDPLHSVPLAEGWFTGLETTVHHLVYCYTYQPQSPEHQGIWAVDLKNGRLEWSRPDLVFAANLGHEFLAYRSSSFGGFPERHFLLMDPLTGKVIRPPGIDSLEVNTLKEAVVPEEDRQQVMLPDFLTDGMVEARIALQRAGIPENAHCESLLYGRFTVAALHEPVGQGGAWRSFIKVWQEDHLLYADCMEEGALKPSLNNFLIQGGRLYYIKKKEELLCIALS